MDKRTNENGEVEYLVKWKDYGDEDNTWDLVDRLDCNELINEYEQKQKSDKSDDEGSSVEEEFVVEKSYNDLFW